MSRFDAWMTRSVVSPISTRSPGPTSAAVDRSAVDPRAVGAAAVADLADVRPRDELGVVPGGEGVFQHDVVVSARPMRIAYAEPSGAATRMRLGRALRTQLHDDAAVGVGEEHVERLTQLDILDPPARRERPVGAAEVDEPPVAVVTAGLEVAREMRWSSIRTRARLAASDA